MSSDEFAIGERFDVVRIVCTKSRDSVFDYNVCDSLYTAEMIALTATGSNVWAPMSRRDG